MRIAINLFIIISLLQTFSWGLEMGVEQDKAVHERKLIPVKQRGKWGYIDSTGKYAIKPQFDAADSFSEGLGRVLIDNKFTFIDETGNIIFQVSKAQFNYVGRFSNGLAPAASGMKYGYIDKNGKVVITPQFDKVENFSEELALVGGKWWGYFKWGYINKSGEYAIIPQFNEAFDFFEGIARICIDGKCGYIDKTGKYIIKPQFDSISRFSEGLAAIKIEGKWGYINKSGEYAILPQFDKAEDFSEGLAVIGIIDELQSNRGPLKVIKFGYIDKSGRIVINPKYFYAKNFSEGLAVVSVNWVYGSFYKGAKYADLAHGQLGYIDKTGSIVIPLQFDDAYSFSEGFAVVKIGGKWKFPGDTDIISRSGGKYGYIDKFGNLLTDPRFDFAYSFSGGLGKVDIGQKRGFIDRTGKFALEPTE